MARIIIHKEKKPMEVKVGDESKFICMCGLSTNQPFCDGSHAITQDEEDDKLYEYDEKGRKKVKVEEV